MRRLSYVAAALAVTAFALALSGCGSDSSNATAPTITVPTTDTRLSTESWAKYEEAQRQAQAVNLAARATFKKCEEEVLSLNDAQKTKDCLSDTTDKVVAEGQDFDTVLNAFEGEAGGACASALTTLDGTVKLYIASVNAVGLAVERSSSAEMTNQVDQANEALAAVRPAGVAFQAACKPVA